MREILSRLRSGKSPFAWAENLQSLRSIVASGTSRAATIYLLATLINMAIPFLLLPILTRYLKPGDYGHIAVLQTILSVAGAVTLFGTTGPLLRAFTVENDVTRRDYLASSLAVTSAFSAALLVLCLAFSRTLSAFADVPRFWLMLTVIAGICGTILQLKLTVLRAERQSVTYGLVLNVQTVINVSVSLILVVGFHLGWHGRAAGIFIATLTSAVWAVHSFRRSALIGRIREAHLRSAIALGGAASLHTVLGVLMTTGDRLVLNAHYSPTVVGLYAVAAQLAAGYAILGSAINLAWSPWLFRRLDAIRSQADYTRLVRLLAAISVVVVAGGVLYGFLLSFLAALIIGREYAGAMRLFPILLGAACLQNLYFLYVGALLYYRKPKILAGSGAIVFVCALTIVFPLSHVLGPAGVAFTVLGLRFMMFAAVVGAAIYLMRKAVSNSVAHASIAGDNGTPEP